MRSTVLRVFVRSEYDFPQVGALLNLRAINKRKQVTDLGILRSDEKGYLSFKSDLDPATVISYELSLLGQEKPLRSIEPEELLSGKQYFKVKVPMKLLELQPNLSGFTSVQEPDTNDYSIQSDSVVFPVNSLVGAEGCEHLIPVPFVARRFPVNQVVFEKGATIEPLRVSDKYFTEGCIPKEYIADGVRVQVGSLMEFEAEWTSLGHSLGELVNSFSLAPCEEIRLATLDWTHRDSIVRNTNADSREQLTFSRRRDQLVQETMDSVTKKRVIGGSLGGGVGNASSATASGGAAGSATVPVQGVPVNFSGTASGMLSSLTNVTFGGTVAGQSGKLTFAADASRQISEDIKQRATSIRSLRSVAVVDAAQSEERVVQTRSVKNHNQCHTLNLMYYEVLKHYNVDTTWKGSRDVLLIEYCVKELDMQCVAANAHFFRQALLDETLDPCFDSLQTYISCCSNQPTVPNDLRTNKLNVTLSIGSDPLVDSAFISLPIVQLVIRKTDGSTVSANLFVNEDLPANSSRTATVTLPDPIDPADVAQLGILYGGFNPDTQFQLAGLRVTYQPIGSGSTYTLYDEDALFNTISLNETLFYDVVYEAPNVPEINCEDARCCAERLMNHINENLTYYNSILWLNEDMVTRGVRLAPYIYNDYPLLSQIANKPLGVIGNWVAFRLLNGEFTPAPLNTQPTRHISILPTRGVFAEALLGNCGACELVDDDTGGFIEYRPGDCESDSQKISVTLGGANASDLSKIGSVVINKDGAFALPSLTVGEDKGLIDTFKTLLGNDFGDVTGLKNLIGLLKNISNQGAQEAEEG